MSDSKYLIPLLLFMFLNLIHPNYYLEYYFKINGKDGFTYYNSVTNSFIVY